MTTRAKISPVKEFIVTTKKAQFDPLQDGLAALDEEQLRKIAAYWIGSHDAMIQTADRILSKLKKAMSDPEKASHLLDRLPKRSHDLLYYIRSEGGFVTIEELKADFPLRAKENLDDILNPLVERGLVWLCKSTVKATQAERLYLLSACAERLPLPSFLEGKLGTLLPARSTQQLNQLAKALEEEVKGGKRRGSLIPLLKTALRTPTRLRRFFDSCSLDERKCLKILALNPQGLTAEELLHQFSLFTDTEPENRLKGCLHRLLDELGLIDTRMVETIVGRKRIQQTAFRLPREVSEIIRANFKKKFRTITPPIPVFKSPDEDFALGSHGKERPTLWIDFQQLLNHLVRCEVGVIRKGGMHKKNLKRILDRLEGRLVDPYLYLDFLFLYAYERNILYPEGDRWRINHENILPRQDITAFYRDFWAFYRRNGSWNDRDSSPLQGVIQKGHSDTIFALRRAILRQISECPVGQWIEMETFFNELMDRETAFRLGEAPVISSDPRKEKFRFMKSTMERSLSWIGIVDTTTVPNQRINLFRLTETGAWLLGGSEAEAPFVPVETSETLKILPNLEVHIPPGFPLEKQLYLARFTDDQKGRIILNRASMRRGLFEGLSVREILDFLREHTGGEIPHNLPFLLEEVEEKLGNVLVGGDPKRIEVNHHALLDELLDKKQFLEFIQERSGERRALLRPGTDAKKLIEELRRAGYTPRTL